MRFVYVMSADDREIMLQHGYKLIKEDKRNHVWVFRNKDEANFDSGDDIENTGVSLFVLSDILTL